MITRYVWSFHKNDNILRSKRNVIAMLLFETQKTHLLLVKIIDEIE